MKDVSPGGLVLLRGSDFYYLVRRGLFEFTLEALLLDNALGPLSRLVRTNLAAYSFVKQSQIPSQATIMKSCSGLIATFLMSGTEVT